MPVTITYELASHKNEAVILIRFEKNDDLNNRVRKLTGVKWSRTFKAWYVKDHIFYREKFGLISKKPIGKEVLAHIYAVNHPALERFIQTLQLKAYSPNTINTYRNEFAQLLYILKDNNVDDLTTQRLRDYFQYCIVGCTNKCSF